MAPKRRRGGTPQRQAKVSRGDAARHDNLAPEMCLPVTASCDESPKNTTASSTTDTAVQLSITKAGPLQYPAPGDGDDSSCSNGSFYSATTLSYSSCSDEEVETMRWYVNGEEQLDMLDGASSDSSIIQLGDSCCQRKPAAPFASLVGFAATHNEPVISTTVEKGVPIYQMPQPKATAETPQASTVADTQGETAVISPPVLQTNSQRLSSFKFGAQKLMCKNKSCQQFSSMVKDRPLKTSWKFKMEQRAERKALLALDREIKEEKKRKIEEKKRRREENLRRREENAKKSEVVQISRSTNRPSEAYLLLSITFMIVVSFNALKLLELSKAKQHLLLGTFTTTIAFCPVSMSPYVARACEVSIKEPCTLKYSALLSVTRNCQLLPCICFPTV
ncbi:hypothetical protein HPB51_021260 [Rhipicephalus microplus]|uniref:Coiled-coil domain-containing protein 86 n=1 Tax=Rhipicephalus microplus TaxID=6941 RepID=A0A9J6F9A7_RHIMP|nr:hypothetical protein HPB51_021260 [Rhipicephalus microplus]